MCMKNTMIPNEYECSACKTILSTKGGFFSLTDQPIQSLANCTMNGKKKIKNPQTCLDFGKVLLSKDVLRLQIQRVHGNEKANGGFQLEFVSISQVINHMTCYKSESFHWWKIYFQ